MTIAILRSSTAAAVALLAAPFRFFSLISMTAATAYKIGTPGTPWGEAEKLQWRQTREIQRSYQDEVVSKIQAWHNSSPHFDIHNYGALSQDADRYQLFAVQSKNWNSHKPSVLITGGVHGYETSGVQGALLFLQTKAHLYIDTFNILVAPCVSPWGYETIQRWNAQAVDPNRSFNPNGQVVEGRSFNPEAATEESHALITFLKQKISASPSSQWICHLDLHETTDTDASEFRPAKAARDGILHPPDEDIPDGFYLVADATNPQPAFFQALIHAVKKVTHIAPADKDGKIIGEVVSQEGVIEIPSPRSLGLCAGVTDAPYATTTEVYPDSPLATEEQCNRAQVACIEAALQYIMENETEKCAAKE